MLDLNISQVVQHFAPRANLPEHFGFNWDALYNNGKIAIGLLTGRSFTGAARAGFGQFTEARIHDPAVLALAGKIRYRIDPENEYPKNFTGHLRATMTDGRVEEIHQPHMRGGAHEPLPLAELDTKFADNTSFGGWDDTLTNDARAWCATIFTSPDLAGVARFRR